MPHNGSRNDLLWKILVILLGIVMTLTGAYGSLMQSSIAENEDGIRQLAEHYHALDRDVAVIKRDTSELRKQVERLHEEQTESQRILRTIDRRLRKDDD